MKTCGAVLTELLEANGIDHVFGIPGVHTIELYRGLAGSGIRHVTPRHEQGAGFMADGFARASGRPAACFIITGPGMTNIATAMGQAYGDSVPMVVVSGVNQRHELGLGQGRLHEVSDQRAVIRNVAAFSHTLLATRRVAGGRRARLRGGARCPSPPRAHRDPHRRAGTAGRRHRGRARRLAIAPGSGFGRDCRRGYAARGGGASRAAARGRSARKRETMPGVSPRRWGRPPRSRRTPRVCCRRTTPCCSGATWRAAGLRPAWTIPTWCSRSAPSSGRPTTGTRGCRGSRAERPRSSASTSKRSRPPAMCARRWRSPRMRAPRLRRCSSVSRAMSPGTGRRA